MNTCRSSRWVGFLVLVGVLTGAFDVEANSLVNGSFEAVGVSASDTCGGLAFCLRSSTSTPGWTQFGDGVDLIHNDYIQPPPVLVDAADGFQFLDMNQGLALGGIEQIVSSIAGTLYRLELDSTAWAQNSIGGTLGYELFDPATGGILANGSFTDNVGGTWINRSLEADATSSEIGVRIQGLVATQAGMGLDNVRLNAVPVPEPGAMLLLSVGLGCLLCHLRGSSSNFY